MEPIKIEELLPESAEFKLKKTGKTYHVRPMTIADYRWCVTKFQGRDLNTVINSKDIDSICQIAFRLLPDEEKEDFSARDCTYYDEETGEKTKGRIGGAQLLAHELTGLQELVEVSEAITISFGAKKQLETENKKKLAQKETTQAT